MNFTFLSNSYTVMFVLTSNFIDEKFNEEPQRRHKLPAKQWIPLHGQYVDTLLFLRWCSKSIAMPYAPGGLTDFYFWSQKWNFWYVSQYDSKKWLGSLETQERRVQRKTPTSRWSTECVTNENIKVGLIRNLWTEDLIFIRRNNVLRNASAIFMFLFPITPNNSFWKRPKHYVGVIITENKFASS